MKEVRHYHTEVPQEGGGESTAPRGAGRLTQVLRTMLLTAASLNFAGCDPNSLGLTRGNTNPEYLALAEAREDARTNVGPFQGWAFGSANVVLYGAQPVAEARRFEIRFYRDGTLIEGFTETLLPMSANLDTDLPEGIQTGDTMEVLDDNGGVLRGNIKVDLFNEIEPVE